MMGTRNLPEYDMEHDTDPLDRRGPQRYLEADMRDTKTPNSYTKTPANPGENPRHNERTHRGAPQLMPKATA